MTEPGDVPRELDAIADLLSEAGRRLNALSRSWPAPAGPSGTTSRLALEHAGPLPLVHLEDQLAQAQQRRDTCHHAALTAEAAHAARRDRLTEEEVWFAELQQETDTAAMLGEGVKDLSGETQEQALQQARSQLREHAAGEGAARMHLEAARMNLAEATAEAHALAAEVEVARRSPPPPPRLVEVPLRLVVLTALNELRTPAPAGVLSSYIEARFGREVRSDRWGALRRDEQRSFISYERRGKTRDAWLCPALDADTGRSIPNLWTVSDWPWSLRLVVEDSSVLNLRLLHRLLSQAIAPPQDTQDARKLIDLGMREVAELGRSFDGSTALAALTAARDWVAQQLVHAGGDPPHDPDDDNPSDPPWLDDVPLSDQSEGRLFGVDSETPF